MVETVEESLSSIIENTTEDFEILVIDDGSTDGSREILATFDEAYERVRVVDGENKNIAQARNFSIEEASGVYVLHQLDMDDAYNAGIVEFTHVFEALEAASGLDVYLRGRDIHMARRDLLLRVRYNDVGYGEDLDLWRRMDARDDVEMVWLSHHPIHEKIGYHRDFVAYAGVRFSTATVNFQTGIRPVSYARWMLSELLPGGWRMRPAYGALFHIAITPFAYYQSLTDGHVDYTSLPSEYRDYCWYMDHVLSSVTTLEDLVEKYGLTLDDAVFSDAGKSMFFEKPLPSPEEVAP